MDKTIGHRFAQIAEKNYLLLAKPATSSAEGLFLISGCITMRLLPNPTLHFLRFVIE